MRIKADDSLEYSHGLLTLSGREVMLDRIGTVVQMVGRGLLSVKYEITSSRNLRGRHPTVCNLLQMSKFAVKCLLLKNPKRQYSCIFPEFSKEISFACFRENRRYFLVDLVIQCGRLMVFDTQMAEFSK